MFKKSLYVFILIMLFISCKNNNQNSSSEKNKNGSEIQESKFYLLEGNISGEKADMVWKLCSFASMGGIREVEYYIRVIISVISVCVHTSCRDNAHYNKCIESVLSWEIQSS